MELFNDFIWSDNNPSNSFEVLNLTNNVKSLI